LAESPVGESLTVPSVRASPAGASVVVASAASLARASVTDPELDPELDEVDPELDVDPEPELEDVEPDPEPDPDPDPEVDPVTSFPASVATPLSSEQAQRAEIRPAHAATAAPRALK
jgi:hypothetical protein